MPAQGNPEDVERILELIKEGNRRNLVTTPLNPSTKSVANSMGPDVRLNSIGYNLTILMFVIVHPCLFCFIFPL